MQRYLTYIALILLLLFCRAMVPDALLSELHPHTHTAHPEHTDSNKAQVGMKHKHCPVEDVFNIPFLGSSTSIWFKPVVHASVYNGTYSSSWHSLSVSFQPPRGPPFL
ncbi:hypothetical protein CLV24_10377 [Pontibacter ummariensis]|uniref:Uncharacterized protein n=1 Tax=Pontibacter ummariensis TaxID=1610492 RepID=A0A239CTC0_9BACT|nr:hypothetical protein [Pontibacter ummariensis]PRY14840.1 hypothetical protein CLV24_10377 [Pontibacter ummariensis]SNS23360.1 hypothetical protein SAMN06296052_103236 [Pontibacter ummariensis]